jgi:hypothetical protein
MRTAKGGAVLAAILYPVLIVVVAVLIVVDVVRSPDEVPSGSADRLGSDAERLLAGARSGTGAHALSREPERPRNPVPPPITAGFRSAAGPADSPFERIGEPARALDQMHRDVPPSAVGDAALRGKLNAMFVNLSRRSQALVERQLRLIEGLEHGEQDEQRLVSLAKLNRIAMRMHRNSQNLLVLAGNESAGGWNQPVTLAHLVQAALSEIEDFDRVSFEVEPEIAVRGPAVHDVVHVLVELIDNAVSFSAAEMPVHIKGHILTTGGALVDITDRGIGMAADEMAYANQQLDNPPAPDIDVPKWMGLLVVARLAARHGVRIRLNQADLGGLTALVWLPDEILTHVGATPDLGFAAAPRPAAARPADLASARMQTPGVLPRRVDPAWAARTPQPVVQAEPSAVARLTGSARPDVTAVDVPYGETQTGTRGLPIFDEVESRWPRGSHEAPSPAGPAGLPRRSSPAATAPRHGPRPPSATPNQRGVSQGWGVPAEEPNPGGPDES